MWCMTLGGGVGFGGLKGIKVTRCNRMALRGCVCVCLCGFQPKRTEAPSLAEPI